MEWILCVNSLKRNNSQAEKKKLKLLPDTLQISHWSTQRSLRPQPNNMSHGYLLIDTNSKSSFLKCCTRRLIYPELWYSKSLNAEAQSTQRFAEKLQKFFVAVLPKGFFYYNSFFSLRIIRKPYAILLRKYWLRPKAALDLSTFICGWEIKRPVVR